MTFFMHSSFGKALLNIGEYNEAMKELQKAYVLEPQNESIRKTIQIVSSRFFKSYFSL